MCLFTATHNTVLLGISAERDNAIPPYLLINVTLTTSLDRAFTTFTFTCKLGSTVCLEYQINKNVFTVEPLVRRSGFDKS
jgi:hypothetical protein